MSLSSLNATLLTPHLSHIDGSLSCDLPQPPSRHSLNSTPGLCGNPFLHCPAQAPKAFPEEVITYITLHLRETESECTCTIMKETSKIMAARWL